jgi:hypothetical protein
MFIDFLKNISYVTALCMVRLVRVDYVGVVRLPKLVRFLGLIIQVGLG